MGILEMLCTRNGIANNVRPTRLTVIRDVKYFGGPEMPAIKSFRAGIILFRAGFAEGTSLHRVGVEF